MLSLLTGGGGPNNHQGNYFISSLLLEGYSFGQTYLAYRIRLVLNIFLIVNSKNQPQVKPQSDESISQYFSTELCGTEE